MTAVRLRELREVAREAMRSAYAPYSKFRVGAALETASGRIFAGCNVENASYSLTLCAERSALSAAVAAGERRFRRVMIVTSGRKATPPCGACRQVLSEFGGEIEVLMEGGGRIGKAILRDLLPQSFGPRV